MTQKTKSYRKNTSHFIRYFGGRTASNKCVVFDMDDTLCVYDEEKRLRSCEWFEPRPEFVELARTAKKYGYDVVIATARPHFCSFATWNWLRKHKINASAVYLRNGAQKEYKAPEVKTKMFEDILKTWEVEAFYDDSPQTVAAIKEMGVNAIFVPGNEAYWDSVAA
jgi:hydroxymethylpyrimidine pyrophosphatase-like HAD family hydrolase